MRQQVAEPWRRPRSSRGPPLLDRRRRCRGSLLLRRKIQISYRLILLTSHRFFQLLRMIYSPCSTVMESFCHFGTLHNRGVIFFFRKTQHIFCLLLLLSIILFFVHLSTFFISYFILHLLNSVTTIFLKFRPKRNAFTTMDCSLLSSSNICGI